MAKIDNSRGSIKRASERTASDGRAVVRVRGRDTFRELCSRLFPGQAIAEGGDVYVAAYFLATLGRLPRPGETVTTPPLNTVLDMGADAGAERINQARKLTGRMGESTMREIVAASAKRLTAVVAPGAGAAMAPPKGKVGRNRQKLGPRSRASAAPPVAAHAPVASPPPAATPSSPTAPASPQVAALIEALAATPQREPLASVLRDSVEAVLAPLVPQVMMERLRRAYGQGPDALFALWRKALLQLDVPEEAAHRAAAVLQRLTRPAPVAAATPTSGARLDELRPLLAQVAGPALASDFRGVPLVELLLPSVRFRDVDVALPIESLYQLRAAELETMLREVASGPPYRLAPAAAAARAHAVAKALAEIAGDVFLDEVSSEAQRRATAAVRHLDLVRASPEAMAALARALDTPALRAPLRARLGLDGEPVDEAALRRALTETRRSCAQVRDQAERRLTHGYTANLDAFAWVLPVVARRHGVRLQHGRPVGDDLSVLERGIAANVDATDLYNLAARWSLGVVELVAAEVIPALKHEAVDALVDALIGVGDDVNGRGWRPVLR